MPSGKHHRLLSTLLVLSHHSLLLTLLLESCPYGHRSLCPHGVSASSASPVGLPHLSSRMSHHRNTGISVLPLTLPLWSRLTFPHPCSWDCLSLPLCPFSGGCSCPLPRTHLHRLAMLGPKGGFTQLLISTLSVVWRRGLLPQPEWDSAHGRCPGIDADSARRPVWGPLGRHTCRLWASPGCGDQGLCPS